MRLYLMIADGIGWVTSVLARVLLFCVVAMLVTQVVLRFGFNYSLPWPEEAARYLMIWIVMLAGSLLVKDDQLVRVDFFDYLWPVHWLVYRNAIFRIFLAILLGVLAWEGLDQALFAIRRTTTALQISWFWPYFAIPVGAGLMLLQMLALTLRELAAGQPQSEVGGGLPDAPTETETMQQ